MIPMAKSPSTHSLATDAYLKIRDKILKGQLGLGQPVSRRNLADEFGMSFVPVAEAIQRLESEGMLESLPRVGTRVRIPTANDVRDRYIIREALEVQSARLFCEKASLSERDELKLLAKNLDKMALRKSKDSDGQYEFQASHVRYHMRIAECTGCIPLYEMLEKNQVLIFNWLCDVSTQTQMPANWHSDLTTVLCGSSPDAAAHAMGAHIRSGMSEIQSEIATRFGASLSWMHKRSEISAKDTSGPGGGSWRQRRPNKGSKSASS